MATVLQDLATLAVAVRQPYGGASPCADAPWPLEHPVLAATLWTGLCLAVSIPLTVRRFRSRTTD